MTSRRHFLKTAGALGALGTLGGLKAQAATGYRSLVCIFLAGGNDGHNTVVPISTAQQNFSLYAKSRQILALQQSSLLPIQTGNDVYGLHPQMPEIQALYNAGNAAILANVGTLIAPTTRAQYLANPYTNTPVQLFSHADQSSQWQSAVPDGNATAGWGGLVEDNLASYNSGAAFSPITSTGGCGIFCIGQNTFPATIPVAGASTLIGANTPGRLNAVQQLMQFDNGLKLVNAGNTYLNRGIGFSQAFNAALSSASVKTPFPSSVLGQQLQTVAKVMSIRNVLGIQRQIFFCQLGGFDTHGQQFGNQDLLLQQLSQAVYQFYLATQELGTDSSTVTFTASEFGRTLQPNAIAGTDHAWGNHHFIIGASASKNGPVKGGQMYGTFPLLALAGPDDADSRGTMIPTTAVGQYAATLAQWFGLPAANVPGIFKYIGNFPTSNLGFLA
jgi:hypothetical protein